MTVLYSVLGVLGYLTAGYATLWAGVRTGFCKEDESTVMTVVFWPILVPIMLAFGVAHVMDLPGRTITQSAKTALMESKRRKELLLERQEQLAAEIREAEKQLEDELAEMESQFSGIQLDRRRLKARADRVVTLELKKQGVI